jgi:hypothetical protein
MNNYAAHQNLVKTFMLEFQKAFPNGRIFQRHVGLFYTSRKTPIQINKAGMADLWALVDGHHFEIEVKTGSGKQTGEQKNWEKTITSLGASYLLLRDISETILIMKNKFQKIDQ